MTVFNPTVETSFDRERILLDALMQTDNFQCDFANSYGEPGYGDADTRGVLIANWNRTDYNAPPISDRAQNYLERIGYGMEWCDEWVVDHDNEGRAYRTTPDSYHWTPSAVHTEHGDLYTIHSDAQEVIDYFQVERGDDIRALPAWITNDDLTRAGFVRVPSDDTDGHPDYESGWHAGQDADPEAITAPLLDDDATRAIVVRLTESSQFYIRFDVWLLTEDAYNDDDDDDDDDALDND